MYYENTLYPLQDKVLRAIDALQTPFYLTGGTALSRCYCHHRYSDDLDFFVNNSEHFQKEAEEIIHALEQFSLSVTSRSDSFYSIVVDGILKVDFVNDVAAHVGEFSSTDIFSRVDGIKNILSNKISAIWSRDEPKDVVDVWMIAKGTEIDWREVFQDVSSKASGIFPPLIAQKLETFPTELIEKVKWIPDKKPTTAAFKQDMSEIIQDMLKIG